MFGGSALFEATSIIPDQDPVSSGKRSGKLSGNAQKPPQSKGKKKAEPLVFQRDSAICENFSKKVSVSRRISRRLRLSEQRAMLVSALSSVSRLDRRSKGFTSYANAYPVGRIGHI